MYDFNNNVRLCRFHGCNLLLPILFRGTLMSNVNAISYDSVSESDTPKKQLEACKSHSQQNTSNQVCSVCLCLHCFAKTTEQQGVMVIKETALQLEDAVLRLPCWQASVRLLCVSEQPRPLKGGLFSLPPGEDFHHGHNNFVEMSIYSGM